MAKKRKKRRPTRISRPLTRSEVADIQSALNNPGLESRWRIGNLLHSAIGNRRTWGEKALVNYAKNTGAGISLLAHCHRLRRCWSLPTTKAAARAGVSFRDAVALVWFDALALRKPQRKKALKKCRADLIQKYRRGRWSAKKFRKAIESAKRTHAAEDLRWNDQENGLIGALEVALEKTCLAIRVLKQTKKTLRRTLPQELEDLRVYLQARIEVFRNL